MNDENGWEPDPDLLAAQQSAALVAAHAAIDRAAENLMVIVSHEYEDTLIDVWEALDAEDDEAREAVFRQVMLAMAVKCLERGRP